ncbi:MAG: hypothetical protein FWC93_05670 [Defluviitaleaceae bacterium]|nr:hypothetical protein [Defluviitaleaceae bacterium]
MIDILGFDFPEPLMPQETCTQYNSDRLFMHHLLHSSAAALVPFVERVLEAEYKNNPIFSGVVDRESLAQLVDRAFNAARAGGVRIYDEDTQLARAIINALVLMELLIWRR